MYEWYTIDYLWAKAAIEAAPLANRFVGLRHSAMEVAGVAGMWKYWHVEMLAWKHVVVTAVKCRVLLCFSHLPQTSHPGWIREHTTHSLVWMEIELKKKDFWESCELYSSSSACIGMTLATKGTTKNSPHPVYRPVLLIWSVDQIRKLIQVQRYTCQEPAEEQIASFRRSSSRFHAFLPDASWVWPLPVPQLPVVRLRASFLERSGKLGNI
jgi:hypothetical protein